MSARMNVQVNVGDGCEREGVSEKAVPGGNFNDI